MTRIYFIQLQLFFFLFWNENSGKSDWALWIIWIQCGFSNISVSHPEHHIWVAKKKKNSEQNVGFVLLRFSHWEFRGNSGCTGSLESWKCRNLQSLKEWVDLGFFLPRQKRTGHSLCQYCCLPVDPWDSGRTHLAKHHSIPNRKFSRHFSPEKVKIKKDTQHSPALPQAERHLDPRECVPLASSNSCWKEPIFSFPNRQKQRQNKTSSLQSLIPHTERTQPGMPAELSQVSLPGKL